MKRNIFFICFFFVISSAIVCQAYPVEFKLVSYLEPLDADSNNATMNLAQQGDYVFLAGFPVGHAKGGITAVDISDVEHPVKVGFCPVADSLPTWTPDEYGARYMSVTAEGDYVYFGAADSGLIVIDISDPTAMRITGKWRGEIVNRLSLRYPYIYTGTPRGVHIIDVSDPEYPTEIGSFIPPDSLLPGFPDTYRYITGVFSISPESLAITSPYFAMLIDVSDPSTPEFISYQRFPELLFTGAAINLCPFPDTSRFIVVFLGGLGIVDFDSADGIQSYWNASSGFDGASAVVFQDSFIISAEASGSAGEVWAALIPHDDSEFHGWSMYYGDYAIPTDSLPEDFYRRGGYSTRCVKFHQTIDTLILVGACQAQLIIYSVKAGPHTYIPEKNKPDKSGITVSPNPTNSYVRVQFQDRGELTISDITGRQLQRRLIDKTIIIDLSAYSTGTYFFAVSAGDQKETVKVLLIK